MPLRRREIVTALVLVLGVVACAGGGPVATEGPSADAPSVEASVSEPVSPEGPRTDAPGTTGGRSDVSDVDWATVDLTTIDWEAVDLRQVDWRAISENPTTSNLSEETIALIQSRTNPGHATLVIGDEIFEFDRFDCASGHENTESEVFSFTTNSFQEFDGVRTQMQFTIQDPTSTGQIDGEGVRHRIDFDDISDFENPSISWSMSRADLTSVDGYELSASGAFDNGLTEGVVEELPGTLEAECSDISRF